MAWFIFFLLSLRDSDSESVSSWLDCNDYIKVEGRFKPLKFICRHSILIIAIAGLLTILSMIIGAYTGLLSNVWLWGMSVFIFFGLLIVIVILEFCILPIFEKIEKKLAKKE